MKELPLVKQMDTKTADTCTFDDLLKPTNTCARRSVSAVGVSPAWLEAHGYQVEGDTAYWREFPVEDVLPMPVARLPLGTPVRVLPTGNIGIVSAHNPNDIDRVRVSWFDRTDWIVRHKFFDRGVIEVIESKTAFS